MQINFPIEDGENISQYCISCGKKNSLTEVVSDKVKRYKCSNCGKTNERSIIIDPKISWWLDKDKVYWHKSVGILLVNEKKQVLLFELTKYPFGLTLPAGHIDNHEEPLSAVIRETTEEVGLKVEEPELILEDKIDGDSCRRGSDNHQWWLYGKHVTSFDAEIDDSEGKSPVWVDLNRVDQSKLTYVLRYFLKNYSEQLFDYINS
jgi:8-oxo-dGTP pyrophosphatase MutT (NUDIX family)/DNA-directed RNA polymerase subunit RPC12/RpoP